MQPRHQIADGNQRICNVQLLLSWICNLCRAQIVTHNRGQEHSGFLGGALWPKCGLFYLSFSCSRQYAALVQNKIFTKILRKSIFFQNISRIPLSAVDIKIVHMVYRFLHKKYLLPYLWPLWQDWLGLLAIVDLRYFDNTNKALALWADAMEIWRSFW